MLGWYKITHQSLCLPRALEYVSVNRPTVGRGRGAASDFLAKQERADVEALEEPLAGPRILRGKPGGLPKTTQKRRGKRTFWVLRHEGKITCEQTARFGHIISSGVGTFSRFKRGI